MIVLSGSDDVFATIISATYPLQSSPVLVFPPIVNVPDTVEEGEDSGAVVEMVDLFLYQVCFGASDSE